jgi:2'-5' RNA ligase
LEADLLTACLDETPFAIQCSGRGAFPSIRHPKIFWVGLGGELTRLFALQAKIGVTCARFVESSDRYSFSPHVTLATIKTGSPRELNRLSAAYTQAAFEPTSPWPIDGIEIFESHLSPQGARHERIARVAFPG